MVRLFAWTVAVAASGLIPAFAQPPETPPDNAAPRFRLTGELKMGVRHSRAQESRVFFPFPADFLPPGESQVLMRTPHAGTSAELQHLALLGEGEIVSGVGARLEVRLLDLYNRNPTSSDARVVLRQAYLRFGEKAEPLAAERGTPVYVHVGLAPRFTKQMSRRMEGYGLWGTAIARFEQPQVELGARVGKHAYARAMVGNGNPVFMRDTNALAGDNGTPERQPGNVHPIYQSGFPILYDAKPGDVNLAGRFEWGAGLGVRGSLAGGRADALGWYFTRRLADSVAIHGTTYSGDLQLLRGAGFPLPFEGDRKREWGLTVQARRGGGHLYAQYADQEIAHLERRGVEVEAAWRFELPGFFLLKESPVGNWIQPVLRYSWIDNLFDGPREYPALSVLWDWKKYDAGLRIGIVRGLDLTAEYTVHEIERPRGGNLPMNELLVTLRAAISH